MELPPGPPPLGPPNPAPPPPEPAPDGLFADEARNRRVVIVTAVVATLAVVAMLAGFWLNDGGSGTGQATAPPTSEQPPTTTTTEPPPAGDAEIEELVDELSTFVAEERGRPFRREVDLTVLDREAYEQRVRDEFDRDLADDPEASQDVREAALAYQALGAWPPGADPVELLRELLSAASLGYYDPETEEMVVAGAGITPLLRTTLAHELVHALDDQHLGLDRPGLDEREDESSFAFSAVVEGSARRVERAYEATLDAGERAAADAEAQALVDGIDLGAFPPVLLLEQQFIYDEGQAFVDAVFAEGGNAAVDGAFRRPPTTSEAILEPDLWLAGEATARPVRAPTADGEVVDEGVVGQFVLHQLTAGGRPLGAEGPEWDGDRYVLWEQGGEACIRVVVRGDAQGFADQLSAWATQLDGSVTVDGDRVVLERCG